MANIKLTIDNNYYMTAVFDESIQAGEDIIVVWEIDPEIQSYRIALAYQNNERKDQVYVTGQSSMTIKHPFNDHGFLGLQFVFDSAEGGRRKTNTIWANIHYSIIDDDNPEDILTDLQALAFASVSYDFDTAEMVFYNIAGLEVARVTVEGIDPQDILTRLSALERDMLQAQGDIQANTNRIGVNENDIATNRTNIEANSNSININTESIADHETRITENTANIASNQESINNQDSRIATNTQAIGENADNIELNANSITSINEDITAHDERITNNFNNIAANSLLISDNSTAIETNRQGIQSVETSVGTLRTDLNDHVSALQTAIDNIVSTTYTKEEIDNIISGLKFDTSWQEPVATFADLATTYPEPQAGWTVLVLDVGQVYNYNGTEWVQITNGGIMEYASATTDGIISSANFNEWQAKVSTAQLETVQTTVTENRERIVANENAISNINTQINEQELNDQDLNTMYGSDYWSRTYYAVGGNTVANKPANVDTFHLAVMRSSDIYTSQLLCSSNTNKGWFVRTWNGTEWSEWTNDMTIVNEQIDSINTSLEANTERISQLELESTAQQLTNENLNNLRGEAYWNKTYYGAAGNTVLSKPTTTASTFFLHIVRSGENETTQFFYDSNVNDNTQINIYTRTIRVSGMVFINSWRNGVLALQNLLENIRGVETTNLNALISNNLPSRDYSININTFRNMATGSPTNSDGVVLTFYGSSRSNFQIVYNKLGHQYFRSYETSTGSTEWIRKDVQPTNLLTNENLNDYSRSDSYYNTFYYGAANNTVTAKPTGVTSFFMVVRRSGSNITTQRLYSSTNDEYKGWYTRSIVGSGFWEPWLKDDKAVDDLRTEVQAIDERTGYASETNDGIITSEDYMKIQNFQLPLNKIGYFLDREYGTDGLSMYQNNSMRVRTFSASNRSYFISSDRTQQLIRSSGNGSVTAVNASFLIFNPSLIANGSTVTSWLRFIQTPELPDENWYYIGHTFNMPINGLIDVYMFGRGHLREIKNSPLAVSSYCEIREFISPATITLSENGVSVDATAGSVRLFDIFRQRIFLNPLNEQSIYFRSNSYLVLNYDGSLGFLDTGAPSSATSIIGKMLTVTRNGVETRIIDFNYLNSVSYASETTDGIITNDNFVEWQSNTTRINQIEERLEALEQA